jgi:hypothetical protein
MEIDAKNDTMTVDCESESRVSLVIVIRKINNVLKLCKYC